LTSAGEAHTRSLTWEPAAAAEAKVVVAAALQDAASIGDDWASTDFTGPATTARPGRLLRVDGLTARAGFLRTAAKPFSFSAKQSEH
jgi:hypothetical protein